MYYTIIDIFLISFIMSMGIIISYEDIKHEKIRNKYLLIILSIAIIYYIINLNEITNKISIISPKILWAFVWSILFWATNVWPAGDAKLFIVLAISFPIKIILKISIMDFLVNVFVPFFLIYFFVALTKSKKSEIMKSLKYAFDPYKIFMISTVLLGMTWFFMKFLTLLKFIPQNMITNIIVLFVIIEIFDKLIPINMELIYVILAIVRLIIDRNKIYTISFVYNFSMMIIVYIIFRYFILDLAFKLDTYKVDIKDLKPGMRPAEGILKHEKNGQIVYDKIKIKSFSIFDMIRNKSTKFIHNTSDSGLTEEDIKTMKELYNNKNFKVKFLLIHKKIPFAMFLFLGYFITIVFRGSFISFLKVLL